MLYCLSPWKLDFENPLFSLFPWNETFWIRLPLWPRLDFNKECQSCIPSSPYNTYIPQILKILKFGGKIFLNVDDFTKTPDVPPQHRVNIYGNLVETFLLSLKVASASDQNLFKASVPQVSNSTTNGMYLHCNRNNIAF